MISELLFHPATLAEINKFIDKPSHALIIEGKIGSGKKTVAKHLTSGLVKIQTEELENYPYLLIIKPINSKVIIDDIRQAQQFLKLKTVGSSEIRRILIIEKAELMTTEAQNAFLKILEEPPQDTVILILTSQKIKLLPTIRSRAQSLTIKPISKEKLEKYFVDKGYNSTEINQAYHIADSNIGFMSSILSNSTANEQLDSIKLAKSFLSMNKFERLSKIDELTKDKNKLQSFCEALTSLSQAALKQTLNKDNLKRAKLWHQTLKNTTEAEALLPLNPNTKLLLTDLLLNL